MHTKQYHASHWSLLYIASVLSRLNNILVLWETDIEVYIFWQGFGYLSLDL